MGRCIGVGSPVRARMCITQAGAALRGLAPSTGLRAALAAGFLLAASALLPLGAADAKDKGALPPGQAKKLAAQQGAPAAAAPVSSGRAEHNRGAAPGQRRRSARAAGPAIVARAAARGGHPRTRVATH